MQIVEFTEQWLDTVYDIQKKAYKTLFDKYHDKETNPYMETKECILEKYMRNDTCGYIFIENNIPVGAVRVITKNDTCRISALAVLPAYQNKKIAQTALREIEKIHSYCKKWYLDTIMQETKNCHLYEKLGYQQVGKPHILNHKLTLINYAKEINECQL